MKRRDRARQLLGTKTCRTSLVLVLIACVGWAAHSVWLIACGPFFFDIPTVVAERPVSGAAFANGELGVVKPSYPRRYLLQSYRMLTGKPPLTNVTTLNSFPLGGLSWLVPTPQNGYDRWRESRDRVLPPESSDRSAYPVTQRLLKETYQFFVNCNEMRFTRRR